MSSSYTMGRRRFSQRSGLESAEDQLFKMALVMGRALAKKDGLLSKIKDRVIKVKEKLFIGVHAKELVNEIQKNCSRNIERFGG